jgi:hypothetical protein
MNSKNLVKENLVYPMVICSLPDVSSEIKVWNAVLANLDSEQCIQLATSNEQEESLSANLLPRRGTSPNCMSDPSRPLDLEKEEASQTFIERIYLGALSDIWKIPWQIYEMNNGSWLPSFKAGSRLKTKLGIASRQESDRKYKMRDSSPYNREKHKQEMRRDLKLLNHAP